MKTLLMTKERIYQREYCRKHWPVVRQHKLEQAQGYRQKLKLKILTYYSNGKPVCASCGFDNMRALCIDHVNGGGSKQLKQIGLEYGTGFYDWLQRNEFPAGYQVLCANCNTIKRYTNNENRKG